MLWAGIVVEMMTDEVIVTVFTVVIVCGCACVSLKKKMRKERVLCMCSHVTLAGARADVGDEASSAGVRLGGALFAGVAPSSANGGAAEGLGADDSTELALTHLVVHLGETRPGPVVCSGKSKKEKILSKCLISHVLTFLHRAHLCDIKKKPGEASFCNV